jgi:hypothetical protein
LFALMHIDYAIWLDIKEIAYRYFRNIEVTLLFRHDECCET